MTVIQALPVALTVTNQWQSLPVPVTLAPHPSVRPWQAELACHGLARGAL